MRRAPVAATVALLCAALMPAAHAVQESFDCGDVIEESIELHNSLARCEKHGLVIGANDITIDLGGESILGDGGEGAGIFNEKGYTGVVVRDGTISGFDQGVLIESKKETSNTIEDLVLSGNDTAIVLSGADGNTITGNEVASNDEGIDVTGDDNVLDGNEIFDQLPAITVAGDGNEITGNEIDYAVSGPDDDQAAIDVTGDEAFVEGNEILAGERGIAIDGDDGIVFNNELEGGAGHGIVFDGEGNEVGSNDVDGYGGAGIYLRTGSGNLIAGNDVDGGAGEGILVKADETRIESNDVDDNGRDGIQVDADDVRIVGNEATDNGFADGKGYGLVATGSNVEGGDNEARGNAREDGCAPAVLCD
jgi:parallel beta-helix repeat protein